MVIASRTSLISTRDISVARIIAFALIQRCITAYMGWGSSVSQAPLGAPGWIGSSATVRLCRHGPFQDSVSEDCPDGIVLNWSQVFNGHSTSASSRRRTAYLKLGIPKAPFRRTRYGERIRVRRFVDHRHLRDGDARCPWEYHTGQGRPWMSAGIGCRRGLGCDTHWAFSTMARRRSKIT